MNPDSYHHGPEVGLPPPSFQYGGNFISSLHSEPQMQSLDGHPRPQPDYHHLTSYSSLPENFTTYNFATPMHISHGMSHWGSSTAQTQYMEEDGLYRYDPHGPNALPTGYQGTPRTPYTQYDGGMINNVGTLPFTQSSYGLDQVGGDMQNHGSALYDSVEAIENTCAMSRLSISRSPKMNLDAAATGSFSFHGSTHPGLVMSDGSDDGGQCSREMTALEVEESGADEPYAKLIYRALMSAPDHSMVLQQIYQWFRENTNKGSSDTKGWMNSIRHNLSMNAAFKKTERKVAGDETKKSTEWVLEPFAIKDGVQSTTRYRKGTGSKKTIKSENPAPARQMSGREGGNQTHKFKRQRLREDQYNQRDHRRPAITTMNGGMSRAQYSDSMASQIPQRQVSPLTPLPESMHTGSPYFLKHEFDMSHDDIPIYHTLEDVRGIYMDNNSPLFVDDHGSPFHHQPAMYSNHC